MNWLQVFLGIFRSTSQRKGKTGDFRFRPRVETLEDRMALSTVNYWQGSSGGTWSTASNWSLGHVPTSIEDIGLNPTFGANTSSTDDISSLTVNRVIMASNFTATVTIGTGNTLNSSSDVTQYGTLTIDPGATVAAST